MATIRNQRNQERLVLVEDQNLRDRRVAQAVRDPGSFYLPSVTGSMRLQPSFSTGCAHGTTRHPGHAKETKRAWPGRVPAGCRASSALSIR